MQKKVLIISSSPRKNGNSDLLCNQFQEGALVSNNLVNRINLREKQIKFCLGCQACYKTKKCIQKDDMEEIINSMIESDVIVLSTPVYFYSMTGQLKTMIDRLVPRYVEISNKEFYFIMSAWDDNKNNFKSTLEALRGLTRDCLEGSIEKEIIYANGCDKIGEVKNHPSYLKAFDLGKLL